MNEKFDMMNSPTRVNAGARLAVWRCLAIALLILLAGCGQTQRTITVESDPPGALVAVNGVEKGRTPVTFDFLWYGDYRFILSKDGFETLKEHRAVVAPPDEWVGVDLIKTVFVPAISHDDKKFNFVMTRMQPVAENELIRRADDLRDETLHGEK